MEQKFRNNSFNLPYHDSETRKCIVGICCMDVKGRSKPMQQILQRLQVYNYFEIVYFGEEVILGKPVEQWPHVDCLITFYSRGFPLEKAVQYVDIHPTIYCVNDPKYQHVLLDRRLVYAMLKKSHIPMCRHIVVNRDSTTPMQFEEHKNYIVVNGVRLDKPFVEKPVNAEDHNIYIYFHENQGGGSVRLFRKVDNKSAQAYPDVSEVRKEGSFIYEEFINTENLQDIKMYTVSPYYVHVEARKSPHVDGTVERDKDGKEIRHVLDPTNEELEIVRKVVKGFHQGICGFDVLRLNGRSYVCDVNGWSFVKGNSKYYDECAKILCDSMLDGFKLRGFKLVKPIEGQRVLRGVLSVYRHADRTPKQKMKVKVWHRDVLGFFENNRGEVKLKNDSNQVKLNKLLNTLKSMVENLQAAISSLNLSASGSNSASSSSATSPISSTPGSPTAHDRPTSPNRVLPYVMSPSSNPVPKDPIGVNHEDLEKLELVISVLEKGYDGTKVQLKPLKFATVDNKEYATEALLVCKWGGVLTSAGIKQARMTGKKFIDQVIPKENKEELIQDIQFTSNNERRVKRTAEEFARELFSKENLPDGFVTDTKETSAMLGMTIPGKRYMEKMKKQLSEMMHMFRSDDISHIPGMEHIESPVKLMKEVHALMLDITDHLRVSPEHSLCNSETLKMFQQRWARLRKGFFNTKTGTFDTTKIPDIFDYITYDVIHNRKVLQEHDLFALLERAESMARFLVPAEYGIISEDKFNIACLICNTLVKRLYNDVCDIYNLKDEMLPNEVPLNTSTDTVVLSPSPRNNKPKVRLYFASESHLHTLKNILYHSGVTNFRKLPEPVELNYLTHLMFKLWENVNMPPSDPNRFQVEVLFCSGIVNNPFGAKSENHVLPVGPMLSIHPNLHVEQMKEIVTKAEANKKTLLQQMGTLGETVPH